MSQRCTVRLPTTLYEFLQIEADSRQCGVSDVIREALERLLGVEADHGAKSTKAPEPAPLCTPPPHDCGQMVLAQLLPEVRTRIVETASHLHMPVLHIIRSLLIAQTWPKDQAAPQIPQVVLSHAGLPPTTPALGTSPSATGARPTAPSPAALGVQPPSRSPYGPDAG
jgi:Arc/MetJ-type ribon-helix-helix transcriptional regulator